MGGGGGGGGGGGVLGGSFGKEIGGCKILDQGCMTSAEVAPSVKAGNGRGSRHRWEERGDSSPNAFRLQSGMTTMATRQGSSRR